MSKITKSTKLEYRNKDLSTDGINFFDEYGEIVDIAKEARKVFGDSMFQMFVSKAEKDTYSVDDFN